MPVSQQPLMGVVTFGVKAERAGQGSEGTCTVFSVTEKAACQVQAKGWHCWGKAELPARAGVREGKRG